ncbi:putative quinol monooxygenase [Pelotalea chapellei]|uniref:Antibiotic biosynthesis monooxygenase n=1 Tax=Pelotalea chapellei TaxID=44671 RepID=A0ABS5U5W1_9BACT|nr:antibiotic biosynthesis monooxygenase family protein [Pelotalea chapellei]MBT1071053.1 antibiotic biosynthesis monooxygenase [Pelotalea chapellei]
MLDVTITMNVPPEKRKEVLQTVKVILGPIRRQRGCIRCNYYSDVEDESKFCFREAWRTRADLDNHLRSDRFGVLIGALSLLSVEPDVDIATVSSIAGPEVIKSVRQ